MVNFIQLLSFPELSTLAELNYDVHDKELLAIYEAFKVWHHYLEGSTFPIDVVTDHKNLGYFLTMKMLSQQQAHWSKYLCAFNLVIRFWPGKLGTKPDALTCHLDLYLKEGGKHYGNVNPHNCRPVFSSEQLLASLQATSLLPTVLHELVSLDVEELNKDILLALNTDPACCTVLFCRS